MDRTAQPHFNNSLDFTLPIAEKVYSFDENEIWHVPSSISEAVKIEVIFRAGKYYENSIGDAQFTLHLLDKGVSGKNAHEIANELDYYGAHLDLKVGYDFSSISLYGLKKHTHRLLPLFYSIIQQPAFHDKELILLKKIVSENLRVSLEKNEFLASNLIREKLYATHPYGRSTQLPDVEAVTLDGVKRFFTDRFRPYKIFIVGNVDSETLKSISKNINLSTLPSSVERFPFIEINSSRTPSEGPSKAQASIRLGSKTISRTHPDWAGLQLVNHILGGYFGSRLMKNIREEKGLTYGIHSSVQSLLHSTWLSISAEVNSSNTDLAIEEIKKELNVLDVIDNDELQMSKNHFIGSLQNDITTVFSASEKIKTIILNRLPLNFYQELIRTIDNIDKVSLAKVSYTYFDPVKFSTVVVK